MNDDPLSRLIKEVAVKHGVGIGRDDPLLMLHTIMSGVMEESATAQQEILASFRSELEAAARCWSDDAKVKAERILTAALAASTEAMQTVVQQGAKTAAQQIQREIQAGVEQLGREAKIVAYINVTAAALAVAGAGLAVWVTR